MTETPTVRRRRLGSELRQLRKAHSLKLDEVAGQLGLVAATLSRIETGKAPIRTRYLNQLLDMYEVTDPAMRRVLVEMARQGHRRGWWAEYDDLLPSGFDIFLGLEAEAVSVRSYEPVLVHGLIQTRDYADAVLTEMYPKHSREQVDRMLELRMLRQQQRLEDAEPPVELWLIQDEGTVRRRVGGPVVMRRQLEQMIEMAMEPNVTIQVLPFESGAHSGMDGAFSIWEFPDRADPEVAIADGAAGVVFLEKDAEVRAWSSAFDRLRAAALSPSATVELLGDLASGLARDI